MARYIELKLDMYRKQLATWRENKTGDQKVEGRTDQPDANLKEKAEDLILELLEVSNYLLN